MGMDPLTVGIIGSVAGGLVQGSAASKAAKAQTAAANKDIEFQRETRDIVRGDLAPYRGTGQNALAAYEYLLGLREDAPIFGGAPLEIEEFTEGGGALGGAGGEWGPMAPRAGFGTTRFRVGDQVFDTREEAEAYAQANRTGGTPYGGFEASPGYQFRLEQGQDAVNALAGARGGLVSGRTLQDLSAFNQGLASDEWNQYLSRVGGLVDTGMNASTISGQASQNAAAGVSNALAGMGNAQAAGAIGMGNAFSGGINNILGIMQYQQAMKSLASS